MFLYKAVYQSDGAVLLARTDGENLGCGVELREAAAGGEVHDGLEGPRLGGRQTRLALIQVHHSRAGAAGTQLAYRHLHTCGYKYTSTVG